MPAISDDPFRSDLEEMETEDIEDLHEELTMRIKGAERARDLPSEMRFRHEKRICEEVPDVRFRLA